MLEQLSGMDLGNVMGSNKQVFDLNTKKGNLDEQLDSLVKQL